MPDVPGEPVRAKVVIIDPSDMSVVWMNESAARDASETAQDGLPASLDEAMPLARTLGLIEALDEVARTGEPRHLRTNLVSTAQGSLTIASSVYLLPDGRLLALTENSWQADRTDSPTQRGHVRRGRQAER